ncbi:MAG: VOC family protein [Deltaproteobacteria bacterium]|nr:VOC family protein [Deltaproteobacteria bacterium]
MMEYEGDLITRRTFLGSLAALAAVPPLLSGCARSSAIPVRGLNHMTLAVSDIGRSLAFYQGLFGMPIQARQGPTPCLQIGDGPHFMALAEGGANLKPEIHHFCLAVEGFEAGRVMHLLDGHGIASAEPGQGDALGGGPLRARARIRDEAFGGAPEGTPELYLGDPDGIVVQLQAPAYCGGAGVLGDVCMTPPEPPPAAGLLPVRGINHFTVFVSDAQRSMAFYQQVFGLLITKTQGSMPLLDVGADGQILGFVDAGGGRGRPLIHHACLTVNDFEHERVLDLLASYGVTPRADPLGGPIEPLSSYVTMRMPDRGGAPGGTPELYFTDPDGILIQLQDTSYCAGSGYLGDVCAYL